MPWGKPDNRRIATPAVQLDLDVSARRHERAFLTMSALPQTRGGVRWTGSGAESVCPDDGFLCQG